MINPLQTTLSNLGIVSVGDPVCVDPLRFHPDSCDLLYTASSPHAYVSRERPRRACVLLGRARLPNCPNRERTQDQTFLARECLLAAIPWRKHRISSELRSEALPGPVSTGVGDRPGNPVGAASLFKHDPRGGRSALHFKRSL